jgi:glycerol-3-phosphate dehydrogenase (NAD(P)+)
MVAEGVETVKSIVKFEKELGLDMPISHFVYDVIYGGLDPADGLRGLMVRPLKNEHV